MQWSRLFFYLFLFHPMLALAVVPELRTADENGSKLPVVELEINIYIREHLATTECILTFSNSSDQDLSGEFLVPLPDQAVLTDLGLYFDGVLRHSVAVERTIGRTAYTEIVHRRVDPALAEWTNGNTFRIDVYPIPSHGEKKIYVAYAEELSQSQQHWNYNLDLRFKQTVRSVRLHIDADSGAVVNLPGIHPAGSKGLWNLEQKNVRLNSELKIFVPIRQDMQALVEYIEEEGTYYLSLPYRVPYEANKLPGASEVYLFWDASGSSAAQDQKKIFAFLKSFLNQQKASAEIMLVPFRFKLESPFPIQNASTPTAFHLLQKRMDRERPAGGTNLTGFLHRIPDLLRGAPADARVILITDGLDSMGSQEKAFESVDELSRVGIPILTVSSSITQNAALLQKIAIATKGAYVNLNNEEDMEDLSERLMRSSFTVSAFNNSLRMQSIVPRRRQLIGNPVSSLTAKLDKLPQQGELTLRIDSVSQERFHTILFRTTILKENKGLVRAAWARSRLQDLMQEYDRKALFDLGKQYRIVTPRTSLIVLESWQDYLRYDIEMPPDVLKQYQAENTHPAKREIQIPTQVLQDSVSSILGTVTDDRGFPLPGVTVVLNSDLYGQWSSATSITGAFHFGKLPLGKYSVSFLLEGFREVLLDNLVLKDESQIPVVINMSPTLTEEFVVVAATPVVDATATASNYTLDGESTHGRRLDDKSFLETILSALAKESKTEERRAMYVNARERLKTYKSFYVRAAGIFSQEDPEFSLLVYTDLAESNALDSGTARALSRRLSAEGELKLAATLLERMLEDVPQEPQTWRDLALVYSRTGELKRAKECYGQAIEQSGEDLHHILTEEYARLEETLLDGGRKIDPEIDPNSDLLIVLNWDTDYTEIDLHVVEPSGNDVYYANDESATGAKVYHHTAPFGPEIFKLQKAP
ncbi:carboxypeptidase regulatory-like domain-containing protein, partial [bacterium]|nr:carboxypeptidase regulatory-like domain-containing protein [bacterium]